MTQVFLNYRTADQPFGVAMIDKMLSDHFGPDAVFLASKSIPLGADWEKEMFKAVDESAAVLVVMGSNWLDAKDGQGRRLLEDPDDFVRREILAALSQNTQVIPVRLDVSRLREADLPEQLRPLARRQDIFVRFRSAQPDIERLATKLRQQIPALRASKPPENRERATSSVTANQIGSVYQNTGNTHIEGDFNAGTRLA